VRDTVLEYAVKSINICKHLCYSRDDHRDIRAQPSYSSPALPPDNVVKLGGMLHYRRAEDALEQIEIEHEGARCLTDLGHEAFRSGALVPALEDSS
jgi:hypothetical protein